MRRIPVPFGPYSPSEQTAGRLPWGGMTGMPEKLPDLYQGHAPIALQYAFHEALEALEDCRRDGSEPFVFLEGEMFRVTDVFASMLECTDVVPLRTRSLLEALTRPISHAATGAGTDVYATWADIMLRECRKRFGASLHSAALARVQSDTHACESATR